MLIAINQHHKTSTIPSHHTRQRITQQRINPKRRHIAPIDRNAIISHSLRRENSTRSNKSIRSRMMRLGDIMEIEDAIGNLSDNGDGGESNSERRPHKKRRAE